MLGGLRLQVAIAKQEECLQGGEALHPNLLKKKHSTDVHVSENLKCLTPVWLHHLNPIRLPPRWPQEKRAISRVLRMHRFL